VTDHTGTAEALEGKASALFLVAGGIMVVFAANTYLKTFAGTSYPVVQGVVAPSGFLLGVVGLFGLYPALADRTPGLTRVAAAAALVTTAGWSVIVAMGVGKAAGVLSEPGGPLAIVPLVVIVSMILTFGLFGVTSLHTGVYPWIVGALLLVESAMFLVLLLRVAPYLLLIDIGHVLAYLGVGVTLRTTGVPSDSAEPAPDSTV